MNPLSYIDFRQNTCLSLHFIIHRQFCQCLCICWYHCPNLQLILALRKINVYNASETYFPPVDLFCDESILTEDLEYVSFFISVMLHLKVELKYFFDFLE